MKRNVFTLVGILCFVFLCSDGLFAQKTYNKAEKQYDLNAYELAIDNYEKALADDPACVDCIYKIAESYRKMNKNLDAAIWYRKMETKAKDHPDYFVNYGLVMKKMGQYTFAKNQFAKSNNEALANHFSASCDYAMELLEGEPKFEVALHGSSSKSVDFAPSPFRDKIVYSSFRSDYQRDLTKINESHIDKMGSQLLVSSKAADARLDRIDFLRTDVEEDYTVLDISYTNQLMKCAYTKTSYPVKSLIFNEDDDMLSIYTASVDDKGNFYNAVPFVHNETGYSTGFPSIANDGKTLYFSSNRPGGFGGYDLYVSRYKNGSWTLPENLGADINTKGNEITPFYEDNTIFFSSDFHSGMGGFDVFESSVIDGYWTAAVNMGNGINSPEDDLFLIKDNKIIYVTSNRIGGRGEHDIYYLTPLNFDEPEAIFAANDIPQNESIISDVAPKAVAVESNPIVQEKVTSSSVETPVKQDVKSIAVEEVEENFDPNTPPPAVDLNKLTKEIQKNTTKAATTATSGNNKTTVGGARLVSFGSIIEKPNQPAYFIQLAAIFKEGSNLSNFSSLSSYGNLYKIYESNILKIKLGYFNDEFEAKRVLNQVKSMGYTDAFISYKNMDLNNMELLYPGSSSSGYTQYQALNSTSSENYKIRLASYEDARWFDLNSVTDLGTIEQWSKGQWTIFILSGYNSYEAAEQARIKAINRGYSSASLVLDRNGILEPVKSN